MKRLSAAPCGDQEYCYARYFLKKVGGRSERESATKQACVAYVSTQLAYINTNNEDFIGFARSVRSNLELQSEIEVPKSSWQSPFSRDRSCAVEFS